ncbi:MAG: GDCCVxC domain-containing (seleno)protein, partial [Candidatus Aminicenantales bacterium]
MEKKNRLKSVVTCPQCGYQKEEIMPTEFCQFFYECPGCGEILKPRQGDCCVFCSYGSRKCPSKEAEGRIEVRKEGG